jgi:hypothetical protein
MSAPQFVNSAAGEAHVETQIGVVHGDYNSYHVAPDASPEEIFRVGVKFLEGRMLPEAREHIERAVALGHETDEVRFYRLLSLVSGRTLRQLSNEDLDSLAVICSRLTGLRGPGAWTAGVRVVLVLLSSLPSADAALVDKELSGLPALQRDLIVDHLGVLLEGPVEDEMWRRSTDLAHARRTARDRDNRIWTFFQPVPAPARVRRVRPATHSAEDLLSAGLGLLTFLYAVGSAGMILLRRGEVPAMVAFLVASAGAAVFVRYGSPWYFRRKRIAAKDAELLPAAARPEAPPDGFARAVDALFDRYFGKYVPRTTDRETWIAQTTGIRQKLRDELVDIYREQSIPAKRIAWLVRHVVSDVRHRWENDTLTAHRRRLRTPVRAAGWCVSGAIACVVGSAVVIAHQSLAGVAWCLVAAVAAFFAVRGGFRIDAERRRVVADTAEYTATKRDRQAAYDRWVRKLSVKPTDPEMAD